MPSSALQQTLTERVRTLEHDLAAERAMGRAELDEAQRRIAELERQLADAREEFVRLQRQQAALLQTTSWRVTAPLREARRLMANASPRALVRRTARLLPAATRGRLKVRLTASPAGTAMLRWLYPPRAGEVVAAAALPLDKEAIRAQAEADLTRFLASGQRVDLARSGNAAPSVSVVVVVYNQAGLTLLCLQALAASLGVDFETLIVDNASSDRMPELLSRVDGVTLLPQQANLGFLRAVNLAAARARGRYLVLLNNDALVEPQTLALAVRRLECDGHAGAVGGPILLWDGRLQEAGSIVWRDGSCLGYGRGDDPRAPAYSFVRDVDYCSGAFLMLRRELFERLGRFDEAFAPAYYEESDFCARLWEAGHTVVYDPRVTVRHFEFASDSGSGRAIELQTAHREVFVLRHPDFLAMRPAPSPRAVLVARQRLPAGALRVLFIDDRVPFPAMGQGYPRALHFVQAIAAGGHFVTHYPLQFPHDSRAEAAAVLPERVEVMLGEGLAGFAAFTAARAGFYDAIVVSRPHNMQVFEAVRAQRPADFVAAKVIYDAEALFCVREIARASLLGEPLNPRHAQAMVDDELGLSRRADHVVAVSEAEAEHYRAAGRPSVFVLGHALEPVAAPPGFERRQGFLFVGGIPTDDTPNGDSMLWFLREVWPRVVDALGAQARLHVVGTCDSDTVRRLAPSTVRFHGRVDDLAPCFDAARVFVVPTRYAAGLPHKAHEAAAHGLPMVATPLIASQLGWRDELLIGGEAQAFAAACVRLHEDEVLWQETQSRSVAAVARDCSPAIFDATVSALMAAVVAESGVGSVTRP